MENFLPINGTDYIEIICSNALQSAHYYRSTMGFQPLAYCGLETKNKDKQSYVLQQGKIRIVLTTILNSKASDCVDISEYLKVKGDYVSTVALLVDDAIQSYNDTVERGAIGLDTVELGDEHGVVRCASIQSYGAMKHTFIERKNYTGVFLPGYVEWKPSNDYPNFGLQYIDHVVGNVSDMNKWVEFYKNVMGFNQLVSFDDKDISTKYTALMSKVMSNNNGRIKFPINEPADGLKKSQIDEYLEFNDGDGVQHIALATNNIVETVSCMQKNGVEFLQVPSTYYDTLLNRVGVIDEELNTLKKLGVLVDRDDEGYLLQIFTKPIGSKPTLFYEIIQRKGAKSFGKGNFKALFEAIEREQELRGTL